MKPTITQIDGAPEFGPGQPSADPRFPQSVHVTGTGFANGMVLVILGPKPDSHGQAVPGEIQGQGIHWPQIQGINAEGCDALVNLQIRGPYQALAIVGDQVSDWFSFQVK